MPFLKTEIESVFNEWLQAWNEYDLEKVMQLMHDNIVFENWDGLTVVGKPALQELWAPWFIFNKNFKFNKEAIFFDEAEQQLTFQWKYEGNSFEKDFKKQSEVRRGVDIMHFLDRKMIKKISYSKTGVLLNDDFFLLSANK